MNRREVRDLIRRHEGTMVDRVDESVDLIVIGADVIPLGEQTDLLDDWVVEASAQGRISVINETQFWQQLGMVEPELDVDRLYTPAMLAELLELPISTIRRWHRRGLITPIRQFNKLPYFDFQEIASARRIATLIASGATPTAIETKLSRLAGLYPNLERPLSQLSVIVQGRNVLLRKGGGLVEPGGQMRIDFESLDQNAAEREQHQVLSIQDVIETRKPLAQLTTPDEFLLLATQFEDAEDPCSATEVYRAMALAFGPTPEVCFRIAELLYQQDDFCGDAERYFMAVELDESFVEARASLGCVLVELGQNELALSAFHGALEYHPEYPDVHFHIGRLLDEMNREVEADSHWRKFLDLAPKSPWAEEARQRLAYDLEAPKMP